jgi:glycine cleavage system aminomethyltransferase T
MKTEIVLNQSIACYDNGGKTADRFTVVYLDQPEHAAKTYAARGMNAAPFHPQGIGMFTSAMLGRHLGKRIAFAELPADCQKLVRKDLTAN